MKTLNGYIHEAWDGVKQQASSADIEAWCEKMRIKNYTINFEGEIDVDGEVWLQSKGIRVLPYKFGRVSTDFSISYNTGLTSLKNCPNIVDGSFDCQGCKKLTTLEGAPQEVGVVFNCNDCTNLKSLKGAPQEVGQDFWCNNCISLTSLEGAPLKVDGSFKCTSCTSLTSLNGPKEVGGNFECNGCSNLTSLAKAPISVWNTFNCTYCKNLTSLKGCPRKVGQYFLCYGCKTQFTVEEVEALCKVSGKIDVDNYEAERYRMFARKMD